jgi:acetyltransferase-like isoleucine patch superfamily enzyme
MAWPLAALCAFGRWLGAYRFFAQACALVPGFPGDGLRIAFYKLVLPECSLSSRICFGSYFAHPTARLGRRVYIGSYCVLGQVVIGERTQIATAVQVLSGGQQHMREPGGEISFSEGEFRWVRIGADCWIGAGAIVMQDIGERSTIGAGSVVTRPIPPESVAVGAPARVIRSTREDARGEQR